MDSSKACDRLDSAAALLMGSCLFLAAWLGGWGELWHSFWGELSEEGTFLSAGLIQLTARGCMWSARFLESTVVITLVTLSLAV